jgi:hypothetical protein
MRNRICTEHFAPISSKLDWPVAQAQIGFRKLLKNDEDAPIAVLKVL